MSAKQHNNLTMQSDCPTGQETEERLWTEQRAQAWHHSAMRPPGKEEGLTFSLNQPTFLSLFVSYTRTLIPNVFRQLLDCKKLLTQMPWMRLLNMSAL